MHKTLWNGFSSDEIKGRILFRPEIDKRFNLINVLIQSEEKPNWDYLSEMRSYLHNNPNLKNPDIKELKPDFKEGQVFSFRLRANPTVTKDKKKIGLYRQDEQEEWLQRKASSGGFILKRLVVISENKLIRSTAYQNDQKNEIKICSVIYEGVLEVTDSDAFNNIYIKGIGRSKSFGFGLLSLAKYR